MATQTQSQSQGLLFSEPLYSETGVWCELAEGIDPVEWASLCRYIGGLRPKEFRIVKRKVVGSQGRMAGMPLVSIGPSGIPRKVSKLIRPEILKIKPVNPKVGGSTISVRKNNKSGLDTQPIFRRNSRSASIFALNETSGLSSKS